MVLCELIEVLEAQPPDKVVPVGFADAHSYRGSYDQLAFRPAPNVTVGSMLAAAKGALGATYTGYKGGEYTMGEYATVNIAYRGRTGEEIGPVLLAYMLGDLSLVPADH